MSAAKAGSVYRPEKEGVQSSLKTSHVDATDPRVPFTWPVRHTIFQITEYTPSRYHELR